MLRILIVEDDTDKMRRVAVAIKEVLGCDSAAIEDVRDATAAKQLMRDKRYDLLVLDIAIPMRQDTLPDKDGGIELLDELVKRDVFNRPRHIVGLTAYTDVLEKAGPRFTEDLWNVILYDQASETWVHQLKNKVKHILLAERSGRGIPEYECYLCVVAALQDPELKAILELPWDWKEFDRGYDPATYYRGKITRNSKAYEVVAAASPRMGMPAAAALAMKMMTSFRPRYLAMPGILAGIPERCNLGDIIVADPVWDYGSGKLQKDGGDHIFLPAPYQASLNSFIRGKLSRMSQDQNLLDEIRRAYPAKPPDSALKMHLGPVASGASVIADPTFLAGIKSQHRKLLGVEMEAYGVLASVEESPLPQPKAFAIKSVCDFGNDKKDDQYQHYAAFTSATALRHFVERYLLP